MARKKKFSRQLLEYAAVALGSFLFAFSVTSFFAPNQIAPGGFSGLATVINYLWGFPIGVTMFLMNVPLFLFAYKDIGRDVFLKAIFSTIVLSISMDLLAFLPPISHDKMLVTLVGGAVNGAGYGLIFLFGGSSGGTDLVAKILQKRMPHLSLGRLLLIIDGVVIAIAAFAYKNAESALYAVIAVYISSKLADGVLVGADFAKAIYIITEKPKEMSQEIMKKLHRGVTELSAEGAYTGEKKSVLLTVIRPRQISTLKEIIKEYDEKAFVIVSSANEVLGYGFKEYS